MKKKILILMTILIIALTGCAKEQSEGKTSDIKPTETPWIDIPLADSSEEKWHIYNEEEREEIRALAEKYIVYADGSEFILAYYEYYDMMDTQLPVVVGLSSEETQELFGGEWIDAECRIRYENPEEMPEKWAYGILTAAQVADLVLGDEPQYVYVTQDISISNDPQSIDERTMEEVWGTNSSAAHLFIYCYRSGGAVTIFEEDDKLAFRTSLYPMWIHY